MLTVNNINKSFVQQNQKTLQVLKNIHVSFPDTGFYAILGKSGSGKSTLLYLLANLDTYDSGEINYQGISLHQMSSQQKSTYRKSIVGIIFQDYNLIENMSVYDNLSFVYQMIYNEKDKHVIQEHVKVTLKKLSMLDKINEPVSNLSGGEKQRLAIARAVIKDSRIILADEPTGNLDSENAYQVLALLKEISKERLVIMVTHDQENAISFCDHISYIQDGHLSMKPNEKIESVRNSDAFHITHQHKINFKLGIHYLKTYKKRLFTTLIVFMISLLFVSLASFYMTYDINETILQTYTDTNLVEFDIEKNTGSIDDLDFQEIGSTFNRLDISPSIKNKTDDSSIGTPLMQLEYANYETIYDHLEIYKVNTSNTANHIKYGEAMLHDGDIIITDYTANQLIKYSQVYQDLDIPDLVGKFITLPDTGQTFLIKGIQETDASSIIAGVKNNELSYGVFLSRLQESYAVITMSSQTYISQVDLITNIEILNADGWVIRAPFTHHNYTTENNLIGRQPENTREILLPLTKIEAISSDLLPSDYTNDFVSISSLLGQTVEINYTYNSTVTPYTVVGIIDDFDAPELFNYQLYLNEYQSIVYMKENSPKQIYAHVNVEDVDLSLFLDYLTKNDYTSISIYSHQLNTLNEGMRISTTIVISISIVFLLLSLFLIHSFVILNLSRSTSEIGIYMSLGFTKKDIAEIFGFVWLAIFMVSYTLTLAISYIIAYLQNKALSNYWKVLIKVFYVNIETVFYTLIVGLIFLMSALYLSLKQISTFEPITLMRKKE